MIVDHTRRLGDYDFEGSIDGGIADEWLEKLDKAFVILGLTEVEKVQNVHGFVKGIADDWLARIRRLYGEDLTWNIFVTEFHKEYLTGSYKKGKQEAFFKLTQGSLSVREYADRFEDLYRFVADIMPSEEIKCDRFRSGLQACMRTGIAWYEGNNFRELVQKTLGFEKARKEELEQEQKNKKFNPSSFQSY